MAGPVIPFILAGIRIAAPRLMARFAAKQGAKQVAKQVAAKKVKDTSVKQSAKVAGRFVRRKLSKGATLPGITEGSDTRKEPKPRRLPGMTIRGSVK